MVVGSNPTHSILDGHFAHLFVLRVVMFAWKDENDQKEAKTGPFKKAKGWGEDKDRSRFWVRIPTEHKI